jgi:hypothetical protein
MIRRMKFDAVLVRQPSLYRALARRKSQTNADTENRIFHMLSKHRTYPVFPGDVLGATGLTSAASSG